MFIQRIKDIFNLDNPMKRLRYFVTYLIIGILVCPILLVLTPDIIVYDGDETLFSAIISGRFQLTEVILYILISGIMCYAIEFFLDAKRLFDIIGDKKISILISSVVAVIGILVEFFIPLNNENIDISSLYLFFGIGLFLFLCLKKGVESTEETTEENNQDNENQD